MANGPYTDGCAFHMVPTTMVYGEWAPRNSSGSVVYGLPPSAAIRPYAA